MTYLKPLCRACLAPAAQPRYDAPEGARCAVCGFGLDAHGANVLPDHANRMIALMAQQPERRFTVRGRTRKWPIAVRRALEDPDSGVGVQVLEEGTIHKPGSMPRRRVRERVVDRETGRRLTQEEAEARLSPYLPNEGPLYQQYPWARQPEIDPTKIAQGCVAPPKLKLVL